MVCNRMDESGGLTLRDTSRPRTDTRWHSHIPRTRAWRLFVRGRGDQGRQGGATYRAYDICCVGAAAGWERALQLPGDPAPPLSWCLSLFLPLILFLLDPRGLSLSFKFELLNQGVLYPSSCIIFYSWNTRPTDKKFSFFKRYVYALTS